LENFLHLRSAEAVGAVCSNSLSVSHAVGSLHFASELAVADLDSYCVATSHTVTGAHILSLAAAGLERTNCPSVHSVNAEHSRSLAPPHLTLSHSLFPHLARHVAQSGPKNPSLHWHTALPTSSLTQFSFSPQAEPASHGFVGTHVPCPSFMNLIFFFPTLLHNIRARVSARADVPHAGAPQASHATRFLSEEPVMEPLSYSLRSHVVAHAHFLSEFFVGFFVSICAGPHSVSATHTRFELGSAAAAWALLPHSVDGVSRRSVWSLERRLWAWGPALLPPA
jgi:hypothetical protein